MNIKQSAQRIRKLGHSMAKTSSAAASKLRLAAKQMRGTVTRRKENHKANREVRLAAFRTKYGTTLVQYNEMLERQGNACATCGDELDLGRQTHVDHLPTEPDWDGYGSPAPTDDAKASAMTALTVIRTREPSVTPGYEGGIQLEWHVSGIDVEFSFNAKGEQDFE